jgi:hypothetical protein
MTMVMGRCLPRHYSRAARTGRGDTAALAGAESPAIGRYERSAAPAGRASDSRCLKKMLLNAYTSMASGMYCSSSSLEVSDLLSSSGMCPSRSGP